MYHHKLALKDRIFCCPFCGLEFDRDYNAALNLKQYFYSYILWQVISQSHVAESSAETLNACVGMIGPVFQQAHLNEAGRQALPKTGSKRP